MHARRLPKLAEAYLELAKRALEAFENAKMRGRFLEDLQDENRRLQKEIAVRDTEIEEMHREPSKKTWLG